MPRHQRARFGRKFFPVRLAADIAHFVFGTTRQAAVPLALGFQRLQPVPPGPPHPDRHAECTQGKIRRIEITRDEFLLHRCVALPRHQLRECRHPLR